MGLETATYVSGLTAAWPLSGDLKSQGDDHIRLLKATLQATFPNATKPFYFPTAESISGTLTLDATDHGNTVIVDTSGGSVTVNLPSGFTTTEKGWECRVIKTGTDVNGAIVTPSSGTINAQVGAVATVRVGVTNEAATFFWSGSAWFCWKPGALIGSVMSFDGATTPAGHLDMAGATYSNTAYAELFAVLATTTLRDRRGRMDIADGTGTGLTARVAGTTYGAEAHTLTAGQIPTIASSGTLVDHTHSTGQTVAGTNGVVGSGGVNAYTTGAVGPTVTGNPSAAVQTVSSTNTGGTSHPILNPVIGVKKIIRAC